MTDFIIMLSSAVLILVLLGMLSVIFMGFIFIWVNFVTWWRDRCRTQEHRGAA